VSNLDPITLLLGLLGGTGITGIAVALYENYCAKQQSTVQSRKEMVFTPDYFDILKTRYEIYHLLQDFDIARQQKSDTLIIRGRVRRITSEFVDTTVATELLKLGRRHYEATQRFMKSGAWFLMPDRLRDILESFPDPVGILLQKDGERRSSEIRKLVDNLMEASRITRNLLGLG